MTTLLPSQREDRVYVGPQGMLVRALDQPAIQESDESEVDSDEEQRAPAKKRWQQALSSKKKIDTESLVIEAMRSGVREASHGVSSTRRNSSKLADQLAGALAHAVKFGGENGPSLVDGLDDQMQVEILSALPIGSTSAAARVCKSWHDLFRYDESGLWQQLIAASSARHVSAASAQLPHGVDRAAPWAALGRQMQADAAALRARWLTGKCGEAVLRGVHADYVMSMVLASGYLITASADRTIALTDVAGHTQRTHVGKEARASSGGMEGSGAATHRGDASRSAFGVPGGFDDQYAAGWGSGSGGGDASSSGGGMGGSSSAGAGNDGDADGQPAGTSAAGRYGRGRPTQMLRGHRGQVHCVHAFGEHVASCSSDGETLIWSLPTASANGIEPAGIERRHRLGHVHSLALEERGLVCGREGRFPVTLIDWRTGELLWEAPDDEGAAPAGMTTCVLRPAATNLLAAGNSDAHSQLRVWDVRHGALRERFSLPAYCKGVRCVVAPAEATLLAGTTNGWCMHFDLRSGRFERRFAHADCCNALAVTGHYLVSGGDDKVVRVTDLRKNSFSPLAAHRVRSVVFAACCDEESIFIGCDAGDVRIFDYSAEANPDTGSTTGGFTAQQKAALSAALSATRGSPNRPAHRTPGRIRPATSM